MYHRLPLPLPQSGMSLPMCDACFGRCTACCWRNAHLACASRPVSLVEAHYSARTLRGHRALWLSSEKEMNCQRMEQLVEPTGGWPLLI
jgi:hypothetical protein